MVINIITRTNNRPNGFRQNRDQLIRCSLYTDIKMSEINHIVITDDEESKKYIDTPYIFMNKKKEPTTEKPPGAIIWRPYNLYFNEVKHLMKDGWVMYIDDDDRLHNDRSLQDIYNIIKNNNEDTLIYFQMQYSNGHKLPPDNWNGIPQLNQIGGSCLIFHTKWLESVVWDEYSGGDFRMMNKLHNIIPNKIYINKPIVFVNGVGSGKRIDI